MPDTKQLLKKHRDEMENLRKQWLDAQDRYDVDSIEDLETQIQRKHIVISWLETDLLKAKARKYDIVFPRDNKGWWWSDPNFQGDPADAPDMLTELGKAGAIKLIKEERRAIHDWWIKTLTLIITVIIGLIGAITGLVAVYYTNYDKQPPEKTKPPAVVEPAKTASDK
jgi:hypothetical protein